MKDKIRQLLRETLLKEKLSNVDNDVNLLYDKYFKNDIDIINRTGIVKKEMFQTQETNTVVLKDPESIEAHKKNMCIIIVNSKTGNNYNPNTRTICISINPEAVNFCLDAEFDGNIIVASNNLEGYQRNQLLREFTEERIKGSIHHELAHWLDDTNNNNHIKKFINKPHNVKQKFLNKKPINTTTLEIQGQIHNIKQLYNKYSDTWDDLPFMEMMSYSPSLISIYKRLPIKLRNEWLRNLKTRMYREGLLGKNMKNN